MDNRQTKLILAGLYLLETAIVSGDVSPDMSNDLDGMLDDEEVRALMDELEAESE